MSESNETENNEPQGDQHESESLDGLKGALAKEREARKAAEKQSKDLERRLAAIENSGKSESEKLAARLKELEDANAEKERAIRERDARDAIRQAARKAGAAPDAVDAVYRMLKGDIEYDDDGQPANVDALLKDAKQIAPQLFRASNGRADGGAGNRQTKPNETMNDLLRRAAGVPT